MRFSFLILIFSLIVGMNNVAFAAPDGDISFYNASNSPVTAKVSAFAKFTLASRERRSVAYSTLAQACGDSATSCKAQFYVNDTPAGSATLNVTTGKLVNMKLSMRVRTAKQQQVLRSVIIQ